MFGLYPLWFRTYRASPAKMDNRNTKTIVGKYQLETKSVEQLESIYDSFVRGRSDFVGWPLDNNCGEHLWCKFGRVLRCIHDDQNYQDEDLLTYILTDQLWFDPYDDNVMNKEDTRNHFVIKNLSGEIIQRVPRYSLVKDWTKYASLEDLVLHMDVHHILPSRKFSNSDIYGFASRYFDEEDHPKLKNIRRQLNKCVPNVDDIPHCNIPHDAHCEAIFKKYNMLKSVEL